MRVEWKKSTKKDLRKLQAAEADRILSAVEALADEPFPAGVDKIAGSDHAYRIRVGDYRVIYEVMPKLDLVESNGCGTVKTFTDRHCYECWRFH